MRKLALVLLFSLFALNAFCQGDNSALKNIVLKLQSFYSNHTIEKAYLHFDKPGYAAGDTIYFKAYVTFGEQHELSRQSGVLYVDLINPQNKVYRSVKLQLINGLGWGDFALPDSLSKGYYTIRAYTLLMRRTNGGDSFEQVIPVGSGVANNNIVEKVGSKTDKPDIQFFPEGGNLLYGVNSKVAFKAIGANGTGLNAKGNIIDNTGKTVAGFTAAHLGMGLFNLAPEEGKLYKADVTFADGTQATYDLPSPAANGIFLNITNDDPDKLTLGISCNSAFYGQNQNKSFSVVINSGISVSSATVKLINPLLAVDLPKKQFRTGVVQFTLFSANGDPLSERLVFIQQPDQLKLKINSNKAAYSTREKVSLTLGAKNKADSVVAGHFSVSVIDESKIRVNENKESTILSWLLLSSDLKGYIEEPNYYFANSGSETQANLDILMLTQGYRRFVWKQLLDNGYPQQTDHPEKALEIKGLVTTLNGKPIAKGKVNLVNVAGGPMLSQTTDSLGYFSFTNLAFADGASYIIKAASAKDKTRIEYINGAPENADVNNNLPKGRTGDYSPGVFPDQGHSPYADNKTKPAAGEKVKAPGPSNNEKPVEVNRFESRADQMIHGDALRGSSRLSDQLNGLINGVRFLSDSISSEGGVPYLSAPIALKGNPPMLVLIDGVSFPLHTGIDQIDIHDVETIEVFKNSSTSAFGTMGGAGVLSINTIKGNSGSSKREAAIGLLPISAHGFYKAREFYSPKYENNIASNRPDQRTTIYWNPELVTGKNGEASFSYYNADGTGTYRVVIEGIDGQGNLGRQVYRYKVE